MPNDGIVRHTSQSPDPTPTDYSDEPRLAAIEYAHEAGVPVVVRLLCMAGAAEGGTGDGTLLSLGHAWARKWEAILEPEYPGMDVPATMRRHLTEKGVCRVWFDESDDPPVAPRAPRHSCSSKRKPISTSVALEVFARDNYRCVNCGTQERLTVDHIVPLARGGSHSTDNFQTLCKTCNSRKGAR